MPTPGRWLWDERLICVRGWANVPDALIPTYNIQRVL
jgi:hypothetical protein